MLNIIEKRAQRIIGKNTILPSVKKVLHLGISKQVFTINSIDILSYYIRKRINREIITVKTSAHAFEVQGKAMFLVLNFSIHFLKLFKKAVT